MKLKQWINWAIMLSVLTGCTGHGDLNRSNQPIGAPYHPVAETTIQTQSEQELFLEIISSLTGGEQNLDYEEAKICLDNFIAQFPESKWIPGALAFIALIDKNDTLQAARLAEKAKTQSDNQKSAKEMLALREQLKKKEEEYLAETSRLQQENNQLKKDIDQLKNLEIRLEKRGKSLR